MKVLLEKRIGFYRMVVYADGHVVIENCHTGRLLYAQDGKWKEIVIKSSTLNHIRATRLVYRCKAHNVKPPMPVQTAAKNGKYITYLPPLKRWA